MDLTLSTIYTLALLNLKALIIRKRSLSCSRIPYFIFGIVFIISINNIVCFIYFIPENIKRWGFIPFVFKTFDKLSERVGKF